MDFILSTHLWPVTLLYIASLRSPICALTITLSAEITSQRCSFRSSMDVSMLSRRSSMWITLVAHLTCTYYWVMSHKSHLVKLFTFLKTAHGLKLKSDFLIRGKTKLDTRGSATPLLQLPLLLLQKCNKVNQTGLGSASPTTLLCLIGCRIWINLDLKTLNHLHWVFQTSLQQPLIMH